jgi:glutamate N-acetyltransferase / amino-acid N-acetyltransferase
VSVSFPRGFRAAGATAGMKPSGNADLALLVADEPCGAAGLFTTNVFSAAPVRLSRSRLAHSNAAQAVIVNSGQANAGTGIRGDHDAEAVTQAVAQQLDLEESLVLACSTGVIGEPLHMDELLPALPTLVASLSADAGDAFAQAIMTTDTRPKQATAERGSYRVGGAAKGVGMISPDLDLATMLVFLTTDAPIPGAEIGALAHPVVEPVFESLTVDGCTSTNDSVLLLASGAAGGDLVLPGTEAWQQVSEAIEEVSRSLVLQLAEDAEGATHVILIEVTGAPTEHDARVAAKAVANSPLVKTAMFGGDPNPGRILQAIGSSGADFLPQTVSASIGDVPVIQGGEVSPEYLEAGAQAARAALREREVVVGVRLGQGPGSSRALGVDLSHDYVRINAEYTT